MFLHFRLTFFVLLLVLLSTPLFAGSPSPTESDPLVFSDGRTVTNAEEWPDRAQEIREMFLDTYLGRPPQGVPNLLESTVKSSETTEDQTETVKKIELKFDTPNRLAFELTLRIPQGNGPFPLLLIAPRFYQIPWADEALRRGYAVCYIPAIDALQNEKDYPGYENVWRAFQQEYPEATWSSSLLIQAWLVGRCLDFLLDPKSEYPIDAEKIGMIGHSRYGKMTIYAAAIDPRIKCIVARSSGVPSAASYRFSSRQTWSESVSPEDVPTFWLTPKVPEFYGREDELPIDANSLIATLAPRYVMLDTAYNDDGDQTFAVERTYRSAKRVFDRYGVGNHLALCYRFGGHNPITPERIAFNFDFFDYAFGLRNIDPSLFRENLLHAFNWKNWQERQTPENLTFPQNGTGREKIEWLLGYPADNTVSDWRVAAPAELGIPQEDRDLYRPDKMKRVRIAFGHGRQGNVYFDPNRESYRGTVLCLGP